MKTMDITIGDYEFKDMSYIDMYPSIIIRTFFGKWAYLHNMRTQHAAFVSERKRIHGLWMESLKARDKATDLRYEALYNEACTKIKDLEDIPFFRLEAPDLLDSTWKCEIPKIDEDNPNEVFTILVFAMDASEEAKRFHHFLESSKKVIEDISELPERLNGLLYHHKHYEFALRAQIEPKDEVINVSGQIVLQILNYEKPVELYTNDNRIRYYKEDRRLFEQ